MDRRDLVILGAAGLVLLVAILAIWLPRRMMGGERSGYVDYGGGESDGGEGGGHH